jgi:rSAM/selenodomain-associated transferase 2
MNSRRRKYKARGVISEDGISVGFLISMLPVPTSRHRTTGGRSPSLAADPRHYAKTQVISVIVPVLQDTEALGQLLGALPIYPDVEIIIVDGGADPMIDALVQPRSDVRVLRTTAGRGHQMNVGAQQARGTWLIFLHADSQPPPEWINEVRNAAQDTGTVGGWFQFQLDSGAWQARTLEWLVALRVRLLRLPYGDQGFFVRRSVFEAMGGYRPWPIMEDVDFIARLVRVGPVRRSHVRLRTSARRWERDGWLRRSGRNLILLCLYFLGVSPETLARWR